MNNQEKVLQAYPEARLTQERDGGGVVRSVIYSGLDGEKIGEGRTAAEAWAAATRRTRIADDQVVTVRGSHFWVSGYVSGEATYLVTDNRGQRRLAARDVERENSGSRRVPIAVAE
jgi:hypothetical protein